MTEPIIIFWPQHMRGRHKMPLSQGNAGILPAYRWMLFFLYSHQCNTWDYCNSEKTDENTDTYTVLVTCCTLCSQINTLVFANTSIWTCKPLIIIPVICTLKSKGFLPSFVFNCFFHRSSEVISKAHGRLCVLNIWLLGIRSKKNFFPRSIH